VSATSLKTPLMLAAMVLLAGSALASELPDSSWWNPGPRASDVSTAPRAADPVVLPPGTAATIEGELSPSSLRLLRPLNGDPRRVRPCLIALAEFGLLRERRTASASAAVRLASDTTFVAGQNR